MGALESGVILPQSEGLDKSSSQTRSGHHARVALATLSACLAQAGKDENVRSGERGASSDAVRSTQYVTRDAYCVTREA